MPLIHGLLRLKTRLDIKIRSSDSIAANLSEGYGRYTPADRKKFYLYARGSFEETKAWLRKALRHKVISSDEEAAKYKEL